MFKLLQQLYKRKVAFAGFVFIVALAFSALLAPWVSGSDPLAINPIDRLQSPSASHWFGTDNFGRDTWSRVVYGGRMTVITGLGVVIFAIFFGVLFGTLSAYYQGLGLVLMRMVDVMMAFPPLLLALVLVSILNPSVINVIIAVGITYLTTTARIIYSLTLKLREEPFVEAIISAGAGHFRVIARHIIPNLISPIIVQATFIFAFALLQTAALDFLGVGLPPEIPSWGNMLTEARMYITRAPWLLFFPGIMIVLTVLSLNLVGDVLRDRLDPRFQDDVG
ncbi:MAG: ABC transporter permease [Desulfobacteraceae bacterium]|jgi:peptide/nickel transport system permease protein|nr:ABC transporter permease [Desulfobacteraceae bacterium]